MADNPSPPDAERELLLGLQQAVLQCAVSICIDMHPDDADVVAGRLRRLDLLRSRIEFKLDPRYWDATLEVYADWIRRGADVAEFGGPPTSAY